MARSTHRVMRDRPHERMAIASTPGCTHQALVAAVDDVRRLGTGRGLSPVQQYSVAFD